MKSQCDKHGCSELLCGCPVVLLEDKNQWNEMIRAKDKYINELLLTIEKLEGKNVKQG